jgi:hypothetical protein
MLFDQGRGGLLFHAKVRDNSVCVYRFAKKTEKTCIFALQSSQNQLYSMLTGFNSREPAISLPLWKRNPAGGAGVQKGEKK